MTTSPYARTERRETHDLIPSDAVSFLDVGCNDGGFAEWLKTENPRREVWGLELNEAQAALAEATCDRVIIGAYPEALTGVDRTFDAVCFNHVLEHIEDPWNALSRTRTVVAPGGCVIAVLPNVQYYRTVWDLAVRGRWDYTDSGILDRTHLRFFTEASVRPLFESSGFRVDHLNRVNGVGSQRFPRLSAAAAVALGARAFGGFAVRATPR